MHISKVYIQNFKGIKELTIDLNEKINILVGKNDSCKSTIIEAINIALTSYYRGKKLDISENLFNKEVVKEYLASFAKGRIHCTPPMILIELYFSNAEDTLSDLKGSINHLREDAIGFSYKIQFDDTYNKEYEVFVKSNEINGIPIEYYKSVRVGFNDDSSISPKSVNYKSIIIDNAYSNISDNYSKRIIEDYFDDSEKMVMTQEQRKMLESIEANTAFKSVNAKIKSDSKFADKNIRLSLEKTSKTSWETLLTTEINEIPFENIGRGEQCIVKTFLALSNPKIENKNIILMEEPESHLSFSKLYKLIETIVSTTQGHQIIITTHNSFVLNKLGLDNLILVSKTINDGKSDNRSSRIMQLNNETIDFFKKRSGYDTLRLILSETAVLVEGDSDDLIFQRAFSDKVEDSEGKVLPVTKGIDVITVGLSFLRFLELASKLGVKTAVITDNDGDISAIKRKYSDYLDDKKQPSIHIFYSATEYDDVNISKDKVPNQNTLEPCIVFSNELAVLQNVFGDKFNCQEDVIHHMISNKTDCALKIFDSKVKISFPKYIEDAVTWLITEN